MDDLLIHLALLAGGAYVLKLWFEDLRRAGAPAADGPAPLPGTAPASRGLLVVSGLLGVAMCLLATGAEVAAGVLADQKSIALSFLAAMLGAAVIEEVVFRGYLVVTGRGRAIMILAAVAASVLFAALHPYLWAFERVAEGWSPSAFAFQWTPTLQAWIATGTILGNSLLWYAMRLGPWNPSRSLLPCIVSHAAYNLAVFAVKAATGKVTLAAAATAG